MLIKLVETFLKEKNIPYKILWHNENSVHIFVYSDFIPSNPDFNMSMGNAGAWIFTKKKKEDNTMTQNNKCSKCNRSYNIEVYPELIADNVCIYCSKNYPAIQSHVMAIYDGLSHTALNRHSWGNWFVVDDSMVKVCSNCDMMIKVESTGTVKQNVHSYCDSNLVE